jgi:hypothetical protein
MMPDIEHDGSNSTQPQTDGGNESGFEQLAWRGHDYLFIG